MKSLKNSTEEEECSTNRLVFSSLGSVVEELGTTEILLQSQLYPLYQRVDLTQDRHCAQSLDLDLAGRFHSLLHHYHNLYHHLLHLQTSLNLSFSLHLVIDLYDCVKKLKAAFKKFYLLNRLSKLEAVN